MNHFSSVILLWAYTILFMVPGGGMTEDPFYMSETREIESLKRCIERCTDDRIRWVLEERVAVLSARYLTEQPVPVTEETPVVPAQTIWPCHYCQAADMSDAERRCVDGAECSAQQEMEKE